MWEKSLSNKNTIYNFESTNVYLLSSDYIKPGGTWFLF